MQTIKLPGIVTRARSKDTIPVKKERGIGALTSAQELAIFL